MIPYTKHPLYPALATVAALAATGAQAVNVSADGRGQVLLYPYYTTRADSAGNPYGTLLSVINASGSAKAVRVRFLEGKNSREVLDFNLFLSPFDVWTAAVLPDPVTSGARIGSTDLSCTLPAFSVSPTAPYVSFANASYAGGNDDGAGTGLDRTKEGYFEIIEMATYASSSLTGIAVTHVNGVAPCQIPAPTSPTPPFPPPMPPTPITDMQAALDAQPPNGGLFGVLTLINVNAGTDYTADAIALANFYQGGSNYYAAGFLQPDLTQATPPVSSIQAPNGMLYESTWTAGTADAVSAVLMHDNLMNELVLDSLTRSGTDWVVTMPTKRFYTPTGLGNGGKLFQRNFNASAGSCDDLSLQFFDREERLFDPSVSFFQERTPTYSTCWAANVVTFNDTNVLGSTNLVLGRNGSVPVQPVAPLYQNGWLNLGFPTKISGANVGVHMLFNTDGTTLYGSGQAITGASAIYFGLPAIGFAVVSFTNGTLVVGTPPVNVLSNYGGNFLHKTSTTIQAGALSPAGPTACVATINGSTNVALVPASGGTVNLAVRGCTTPSTSPITYSWTMDGTFLSNDAQVAVGFLANTTGVPITNTYRVRVCAGFACTDLTPTPLTSIVAAG